MKYEHAYLFTNGLTAILNKGKDMKVIKNPGPVFDLINNFANEGWELVTIYEGDEYIYHIYFKRPVRSCLNNCPNDDLFRQETLETLETANVTGVDLLKRAHTMLSDSDAMWDLTYVTHMSNERFAEWRRLYQDIADHLQIAEAKRAMAENYANYIQEG